MKTPEVIKLSMNSVPRLFNFERTNRHCALDIVAHVRGRLVRDPWVPVVIDSNDAPVINQELESYGIYWKGVNEDKAGTLLGISASTYCVVNIENLNDEDDDCGLDAFLAEYSQEFSIFRFEVIINCAEDSKYKERLDKLRRYVLDNERLDVIFPVFVVRDRRKLPNGLDLSGYAQEIKQQRYRNSLDYASLKRILDEIDSNIIPGVTVLQDLHEQRIFELKVLMDYLTLKHMLPPTYVASFITEYVEYQLFYPRSKLSLFERVMFLRRLPSVVGYIGICPEFNCLGEVMGRIYPHAHYAFDLRRRTVEMDPEWFNLANPSIKVADFRQMFPASKEMCVDVDLNSKGSPNGMQVVGSTDVDADNSLRELFAELANLVSEESVFLTVKNCLLCERGDSTYILYCPEECGVQVKLITPVFGAYTTVIPESDFNRLCDAQIEKALLARSRVSRGGKTRDALVRVWNEFDYKYAMQPAIPLEVTMRTMLLPVHKNGLSYYDRCLRCLPDILPTITSIDSKVCDVSPIFNTITGQAFLRDPQVRKAVTCFGTLSTYTGGEVRVPVTYQVADGGLL